MFDRPPEEITTEGGHLGRIINFIQDLKETNGNFNAVFRLGINADTLDAAIGISINGGTAHPFTIVEARQLADTCEETLTEAGASYENIEDTVKTLINEIRDMADLAEQHHGAMLSKLVKKH